MGKRSRENMTGLTEEGRIQRAEDEKKKKEEEEYEKTRVIAEEALKRWGIIEE